MRVEVPNTQKPAKMRTHPSASLCRIMRRCNTQASTTVMTTSMALMECEQYAGMCIMELYSNKLPYSVGASIHCAFVHHSLAPLNEKKKKTREGSDPA